MKRTVVAILFIMTLAVSSCEIDGTTPCAEEVPTTAIVSEFPDSLKVGTTYVLDIAYILNNNCGEFDRFEISANQKAFDVQLITKYEGCNCNIEMSQQKITFDIIIDFPGLYQYNFWQADGDYDTRSVTIYE